MTKLRAAGGQGGPCPRLPVLADRLPVLADRLPVSAGRRRLLLGATGAALSLLGVACSVPSDVPAPTPASPSPVASPAPPGALPAPAGPVATSVQIVPGSASPAPRAASPGPLASPSPRPVVLGRPGLLAVAEGGSIVLVDPFGQQPAVILARGPDYGEPRWSPDGQRLVVLRGYGAAAELFVVPATGGPPLRLTSNTRPESGAVWSPRGDRIAYVLPRPPDAAISASPVASPGPTRVPSPAPAGDGHSPAEIWLLDVAAGATAKLADGFDPAWSADGQSLVYATNGRPGSPDVRENAIHIVGADGQGDRRILAVVDLPGDLLPAFGLPFKPSTVRLRAPSWSPDGVRVAASADGHTSMAVTFDARGQDVRPWAVSYAGGVGRARWSPDGTRLAVESRPATGVAVVSLADLAARHETTLGGPAAGFQASGPAWSPDGQRLAVITTGLPGRHGEPREQALRLFGADGADGDTLLTTTSPLGAADWAHLP